MEEDVQLLFAYARRGDVQSLAALVRRHATWMQALLRGMLPVAADVDDVFQETWMRVIRAASRYRGGLVKPYLATVARSAAIDHMRRTRATVAKEKGLDGLAAFIRAQETQQPLEEEGFLANIQQAGLIGPFTESAYQEIAKRYGKSKRTR